MSRTRILLADDHQLFLDGLGKLLESDFEVVGTVNDGNQLIDAVELLRPDVVIIDISMPGLSGLHAARNIHEKNEDVKMIFLTMHNELVYAMNAFEAGASGYVLKHAASEELLTAIVEVCHGRTFVSALIAGELVRACQDSLCKQPVAVVHLSDRQREVIQLIARGLTLKEIAATMNISAKNVEYHKYRIMGLLNLKSTAELIRYAVENGFILPQMNQPFSK